MNRAVCSYQFVPSGTLEVLRSVCQMNGALQSGAEWCTTQLEAQTAYEGKIQCLFTVTFLGKVGFLISNTT